MDITIPIHYFFGIAMFLLWLATFLTIFAITTAKCAFKFELSRFVVLSGSAIVGITCSTLVTLCVMANDRNKFIDNVESLYQAEKAANSLDVPLHPEMSRIIAELRSDQSNNALIDEIGLYSKLSVRLKKQMDQINRINQM